MSDTISTLERVGDKLAEGVMAIITADGASFPLPVFGVRRTGGKMDINRVEVRASNFFRASDQMNFNPAGQPFYNHRRGILSLTVVTQRQTKTSVGSDSAHGLAIGRLRWLMSRIAQKLVPASVGTYEIQDVIDLGETPSVDEPTDTDRTELRFQIDLVVPADSYSDS